MEDTLRDVPGLIDKIKPFSLNPCCNGRYSQRVEFIDKNPGSTVLILVLMEDTLRENLVRQKAKELGS